MTSPSEYEVECVYHVILKGYSLQRFAAFASIEFSLNMRHMLEVIRQGSSWYNKIKIKLYRLYFEFKLSFTCSYWYVNKHYYPAVRKMWAYKKVSKK